MTTRSDSALLRGVRGLASGALDLLVPPECCGCQRSLETGALLCLRCDRELPRLARDRCQLCQQAAGPVCSACAAKTTPLAACVAAASFEGIVETWIHRFKYPGRGLSGLDPSPGRALASLAVEAAGLAPEPPPRLIVPVPLHPKQLRRRGFNPACLLARAIAREIGACVAPAGLRRVRDTPSQTGLDRSARQRNVRDAFAPSPRLEVPADVWLVDDVVTTGATLSAAARALREAGAQRVVAVCAARTLAPG
jgi:ComF family protein